MRYLHFGSEWVQGAMRIARPWALELEYAREMMMALVLRPSPVFPASALHVGLGAASVPRFLHRYRPGARQTVIEIDPEVVSAARQFFKLPEESARFRIQIGDGHEFMAASRGRFDLIVVDGFDGEGRTGMLDTVPFYFNCMHRLTERGVMAVNLVEGRSRVSASIGRIAEAFGQDRVLVLPRLEGRNTVALAGRRALLREGTGEELREAAAQLKAGTGLDLAFVLDRMGL